MKQRIFFLLKLFILFIIFFAVQKIIFIAENANTENIDINANNIYNILIHGFGLDASTTGYLIIIPFVITWISIWYSQLKIKNVLKPYFIIISILLSVITILDTSLYEFWKFKLDATIFNYIDAPKQALASVSTGYILIRIVIMAVSAILLSSLCIICTPSVFPKLKYGKHMIGYNAAYILAGGIIFLFIRGGVGRSTMNIGNAYFSEKPFMNHAAVNPAFNLLYSWRKSEKFSDKYNWLDETLRANLWQGLYPDTTEDKTDSLLNVERPNILIIILEGYGSYYLNDPDGNDVSPNIKRLIKESIYFDNVYANSFRTDRGLVSALSGHVSYPTTSIMKIPAKSQNLPGIARTLQNAGYSTEFLYGGDINFTNMKSYFTSTGYSHLIADTDFELQERNSSSWGAHDQYTFKKLMELIKAKPTDKPWHIGFLTLSSHEPFEVPYQRLKDKKLNSFAYTDHCLGTFIDELKQTPIWNNLLVICLPDHGSALNVTTPEYYHIPMLWMGGAIKRPQIIQTLMNQSDMPATLLSQLNLPHQEFQFSRNIFSRNYRNKFAYSTFSDGFAFRDSTGVTIFDNAARRIITDEPAPNADRENKGKAILQTSYDLLDQR